ncbi:hypothetical protein LEP1GSC005_2271 [Leptospira santarosai str. ST188]|uniref:Uncharacterized protein n=1 Tax=Leptospira santarosai serovar Arenal str. MAVJ 401 TaxID=1049976 RepID=M6JP44_9LEPT|nr:hypothetical protein LEP1GSC005_2271 [Leptospira santarosai str. ST188]EMM77958.1 hypothetical protein LEP1GSC040_2041 [Leptospira santarosai str. 2000030832]EMN23496.1 hypothetical protein LEP1GSC063_0930 [Leptospira santarosai serovar Arenal str. MAVJ 401]
MSLSLSNGLYRCSTFVGVPTFLSFKNNFLGANAKKNSLPQTEFHSVPTGSEI